MPFGSQDEYEIGDAYRDIDNLRRKIDLLTTALKAAHDYIIRDMMENSPRSDDEDKKLLAFIAEALNPPTSK